MNTLSHLSSPSRHITRLVFTLGLLAGQMLSPSRSHAGLPQMEAPSRGDSNGIIQTLQNYGYDIVALVALAISAAAFCGVAYHAYSCYSEVQTGKKTWGQFGLTCGVGALLLVIVIWLLTKGTGVL
ncbi:TIGR03745 family integrating conjugative element membrane protein [Pseudomonas vanderleydeniana]|uniref:TIGR03745 family integrating conjugative element membrane protein n=1 Tax=Pseudomonas vanderleydeniana TaxID=2745495 RepID=A0A9E6TPB0_9PSED|nr:TIGR03745 family integrating conjugative element membrane protein [Pseudomonas vanderleydeniana]QXI26263.1 TIGR03745 family integrating conjugative element membrane protein [Pseudomonas vanderleydeniana]